MATVTNTDAQVAFGERVREIRIERDMTQRQLANLAKKVPGDISRIEAGMNDVRLSTMRALASALDVPLVELFA